MQNHTTMKTILASRVKEEVNDWLSTGKRLIPIFFFLLFGVGNAWGDTNINFSGGYIYFADTYNVHKGSTQLCGRKSNCSNGDWYTAVTTLNNISHTKLYYTSSLEGSGWSNVCWAGWALISNSSAKSNANTEYWKGTNSTWYSNFDTYGLNSGSTYLITVASASKGASKTTSYLGNSNTQYTSLNHSQTVEKYTFTNNGSSYSKSSTNSGEVTITAYKMNGHGTVTTNSGTFDAAAELSASADAAYTGEVTLSATAYSGYTFVGWYDTSDSQISTDNPYTYNAPNSTKTIRARFKNETTHNVTVSYKCGDGTIRSNDTEAVGVTTHRNITAPDIDGFTFSGWTVGSGLNNHTGYTTTNPIEITTKASGSYTLTANYTCNWELRGSMDSWGSGYSMTATSGTSVYAEVTLDANTDYSFKFINGSTWYGVDGTVTKITYTNKATARAMTNTTGGSPDQTMTSAGAGTYRFTWDITNKKVTVTYPTSYTVEFEVGTVKGNVNNPIIYHTSVDNANKVTSGKYVAEGTKVIFWIANSAASAPKAGYNWWGFYNNAAGTGSDLPEKYTDNTVSVYTVNSIAGNMHVYAVFGEIMRDISTYNVGDGSTSPTYGTAGVATSSGTFTATPSHDGYMFSSWSERGGSNLTISASGNTATVKASADGTLQANFVPRWSILGTPSDPFGGWSAYNTNLFDSYSTSAGITKGSKAVTLAANTVYEIKTYDRKNSTFYGGSANQDIDYAHSGTGTEYTMATTASPKSVFIHSAAGGSYTLYWNVTQKKLAVQYPTSWYITSGQTTEGQDAALGGSFTAVDNSSNNVKGGKFVANGASVTFEATPNTGYNFSGWWSDAACTSSQYTAGTDVEIDGNAMTLSSIAADKTVYAKFTAKTYTVTLTRSGTGYGSGGTASVTATYNQTLPAATMPTAAQGYAFMGYYTAADGEGSQLVAANGTWQNVAGYTSGGKWIRDGGAELFAYFKKGAISALTLDAAIVAQGNTVGITPTLDPVPVGDKVICWRVLHGNGNPLDDQPAFSWDGTKVTFPASANSGTYLAEAILRKGTTCGGEVLDSVTVSFQVAGDHTVTVQYKCGDDFIQASTSVTGKPLEWTSITAPNIFGYTFSKWKAGDGITIDGADGSGEQASATINFKATYEGKLTAIYTQKRLIYFKNTLGWSDVYVNFYTGSYWNNPKGSGNNGVTNSNKHMTRLDDTDIWYYDYGAASITPSLYVSFTSASQTNAENFWASNPGVNVVYPANYQDAINTDKSSENGFKAATPMFVPIAGQTATVLNSVNYGKANYFNRGYWVQYTPGTGYTLEIYNSAGNQLLKSVAFTSDGDLMPMEATVDLEAGKTYKYQLRRGGESAAGVYYGNSNTMAYNNCTGWEMINSPSFSKAGITANAAGDYKFTLNYAANASSQYRLRMTVKYPVSMGDFRIVYSDNDTWSRGVAHTLGTWIMKSHTITARANGIDTVSFFISRGHSPEIRWEKATSQSGTAITWGTTGPWLTTDYTDVSESAVYNFKVTQNAYGTEISSIERIGKYTGDYYIRVDCANSKWDNYTVDPDHRMTYSEYSIDHGGYSHYYCHWVQTDDRKNVKFCIANDYSPSISDTLTREVASGEWANIGSFIDAGGNILRNANVRFMWNQSTNKISRAYIDGAQGTGSDNFLKMLSSDSKIKDLSGTTKTEVYFQDNENWIYETNIQAQPNAQYKLVSNWGTSPVITQYFKGSSSSTETLITGSGDIWYVIRVIYDFKTNRILAAWMPEGELEEAKEINADVMFIREHQGDINQLILNEEGEISKINTAYGVMRFNKWTINNKEKTGEHNPLASPASIYERSLYWVSFPFRVKLSEVFGFGTYGTHWILQYYDGAERAEKGMWAETGSYWKFIWDRKDFILEPNTGYLLALETELMRPESSVWGPGSKADQVELFFPSYGTMPDITQDNVVIPLEEHTCTINRSGGNLPGGNDYRTTYDRRIVDSHWNVMGVPTYVNTDDVTFPASEWTTNLPKFLYTWNADDNTITAASASGFTFHAMHAYMVQYYGNVTWAAHSGSPYSPIVARSTYSEKPKEVEFCIELTQNETMLDRTFINLSDDEAVSAGFAFNEDMTKEFSGNKPAIYTFIDTDVVAAGNTLPMSDQKTIVPLGVETKQAGDYTIAIPNGTNGVGVTLIDEETGVHTSLSALDYTVSLPAGKHDNRFFLEISPIKTTPTGIEDVQGGNVQSTKVHKVMIDGILYIVKDGKIFDARGARLR